MIISKENNMFRFFIVRILIRVSEFWGGATFDRELGFSGEVVDYTLSFDMHTDTLAGILGARSSGAKFEKGWRRKLDNTDICQTLYKRVEDIKFFLLIFFTSLLLTSFTRPHVSTTCPRISNLLI